MKVEQISIFLENRAGRLEEVTRILAESDISIRALSLADTSDFGILRLIVSDHEKAKAALKQGGFTVGRNAVVAVEVPDKPGGLHFILNLLSGEGINVEYMYAFVHQSAETAVIIFRFDRTDQASDILQANDLNRIPGETLYSI